MKCVCGYEHQSGIDATGKYQGNLVGDEKFRHIEGSVFRVRTDDRYSEFDDVHLFACPKCGTVRIENRLW